MLKYKIVYKNQTYYLYIKARFLAFYTLHKRYSSLAELTSDLADLHYGFLSLKHSKYAH